MTGSPIGNATRREAKKAAILEAAGCLIIERGFEGANLDAICERAGCSKTSIYAYFGNKEGLLEALTEDISLDLSKALHALYMEELGVEESLRRYARLALRVILDEKHIAIVRATISAVWKYPHLGPAYYEMGAATAQSALAQYLETQMLAGTLNISDSIEAAKEFQGRLLWDRMLAQIVGAHERPEDAEIESSADAAVENFLVRYRAV
ncbi:MAG TPA: hypothetical protein DGR97_05535 [Gammaproteobacteria bacterium]|nr:hypothetical protein [Gammaproteobacteria bacterium]|tara:strand:+ start:1786 stop:2412 length:627 start_codon:yes stop_codon:yes gene_type:complete